MQVKSDTLLRLVETIVSARHSSHAASECAAASLIISLHPPVATNGNDVDPLDRVCQVKVYLEIGMAADDAGKVRTLSHCYL